MNPNATLQFKLETTKVAKPIKVQFMQSNAKPSSEVVLGAILEFKNTNFEEIFTICELNNMETNLGSTFLDTYCVHILRSKSKLKVIVRLTNRLTNLNVEY
jgi:ribosomal 50S subunit-recycling heat shock protein